MKNLWHTGIFLLLSVLQGNFTSAQNEAKQWFFGAYQSLNFNSSPPTASSTLSPMIAYCSSSIADATGNLRFYTNGNEIWDATHNTMANGNSLLPANVSVKSTIILKKPGSANLYYVFSQSASNSAMHGLFYSIVDMALASGQGSVVVKGVVLDTTASNGKLAATNHCNGSSVWLLTHNYRNNQFKAFQLSTTGISNQAVVSAIGQIGFMSNEGQMKFSPNGKKLAYCASSNIEFFDFDNASGLLSNYLSINSNLLIFLGCDFSPDGTKVYTGALGYALTHNNGEIAQWNLCAGSSTAISASKILLDTSTMSAHSNVQLGTNGKIYISNGNEMKVINNPNALGAACGYSTNAFYQYWQNTILCLPNFNSSFFNPYTTNPSYSIQTQILCQTVSFSFTASNNIVGCSASGITPNTVLWDFGDPGSIVTNTSTAINTKHVFSGIGTYTTRAIITHDCKTDTLFQLININGLNPIITLSGRDTICQKEWLTLSASGANNYLWSTGATSNSITVMPQFQYTYAVVGTNNINNCSAEKVFTAHVNICENIIDNNTELGISLFPNPANQQIHVFIPAGSNKTFYVRLSNLQGQVMVEKCIPTNTSVTFDLSEYETGIYFIAFMDENKISYTKKVLITGN